MIVLDNFDLQSSSESSSSLWEVNSFTGPFGREKINCLAGRFACSALQN